MLCLLVSPVVVSAVTGGPYHGTPLLVLIARFPLCRCAALAVGQTPLAPAWMCMACLPSNSRVASTDAVRRVPVSRTTAVPMPWTRFVGTGARLPSSRSPGGAVVVGAVVDGRSDDEGPELLRTIVPTATAHATAARTLITGARRCHRGRACGGSSRPPPPAAPS